MRSFVIVLTLLSLAVGSAPAAFAGTPAHRVTAPESVSRPAPRQVLRGPGSVLARPRQTAETGPSVSGHLFYGGPFSPMGAYPIEWWIPGPGGWQTGSATSDATGWYAFGGIPPASGNGELFLDGGSVGRTGLSWSDAEPATFDFTRVDARAKVTRGGPWSDWAQATLTLWGDDGISAVTTTGKVANPGPSPSAVAIGSLPGRYTSGTLNFWANEGVEFGGLFRSRLSNWLFPSDIEFTDADHGWATTGFSETVMRTVDGGASWRELTPNPTRFRHLARVDFSDALHGLVLDGATTNENRMLRTSDGGATWAETILPGIFEDVACPDALHAWAVGAGGAIISSTDGGATWTAQASGTGADLTCVAFSDADNGWAVGDSGVILHTANGGASWEAQDSGTTVGIDFLTVPDARHAFACVGGGWAESEDDAVIRTTDGGATWARTTTQPTGDWIGDLAFADAVHGWALGPDTVSRTSDGGATWQASTIAFDCYLGSRPFAAASATRLWLGCGTGLLTDSTDGGVTWTPTSATFDENKAQRLTVSAPFYASGAPGTKVKLRFTNFPAGWTSELSGYAAWPSTAPVRDLGSMTSTGVASQYRTVTIPRTATPGYFYLIDAAHQQGPLRLEVPFEVCTLKSSPTSIRRGAAIKLSGIVPTQGHQGTVGGERKYVAVFSRTTAAGQPTVSDPRKRGWKLLKVLRTDRAGAYHTGLLKPTRTTWYVVSFGGDDWYWGGYTSVVKVAVR